MQDPSWDVVIRAVDLNPAALEKAEQARYSSWALRETSPEVRQRWFRAEGRDTTLVEAARTAVQFEQKNLAAEDPELWRPAAYDVIFCRNVIMYFAPEQMRAVINRIAESLAPGGFLFLGHAETLRGLSDDFHLRHTHETFYYKRKENSERALARAIPAARISSPPSCQTKPSATPGSTRFATPPSVSQRSSLPRPPRTRGRPRSPPAWDRARTIDLLRRERFAEALACVRRQQPSERDANPDKLLLEATLLAHASRIEAAEDVCRRLLSIDELNAGAHYVLALCREQAGDRDAAAEHDRVAIYLDSAFAMPRLHLGLLARRAGDHGSARRELAWALVLLKREDASRLLLFGGGFNRDALMALCESALRSCGERS